MTTALQKTGKSQLQIQIENPSIQARFREVLKDRAPQFISSMLQVGNSLGHDCESMSIISGSMTAASLDLPINKNLGFAWLVPFKDKGLKKAQFQMGYKGYIQLALRTGQYRRMNAGPINEECLGGYDAVGERIIDFSQYDPAKPAAGYFFAFEMVNGFVKRAYWSKSRVEAHARQYSQSYRGGYDSPWKSHFDAQATKTVISNELRKWGILSVEMQRAMETDGAIIEGLDSPQVTFPEDNREPVISKSQPKVVEVESSPVEQENQEDGDLAPVAKPQPNPVPETQLGEMGEHQSKLQKIASGAGFSFDEVLAWGAGMGLISNADNATGYSELKGDECRRLTRSPDSLVAGIRKWKEEGK